MNNVKFFLLNGYQEYTNLMVGGAAQSSPPSIDLVADQETFYAYCSLDPPPDRVGSFDDPGKYEAIRTKWCQRRHISVEDLNKLESTIKNDA